MRISDFSRCAIGYAVAITLAGCGDVQTGTPWQAASPTSNRAHGESGSSGDLIYVTTTKAVEMVSYPQGKIVGSIPWYTLSDAICSDPNSGNVFIPEGGAIYKYAHGGTSPIATLSLPSGYYESQGCTVDPTTGNVAATLYRTNQSAVAVYPGGQGPPTMHSDNHVSIFSRPTYDDAGDLYITCNTAHGGVRIAELPAGKSQFTLIKVTNAREGVTKIQWDGTYLAIATTTSSGGAAIDQLQINGKTAERVNTIVLNGGDRLNFWIQSGSVFGQYYKTLKNNNQSIAEWPYPAGGSPTAKFFGLTKGRKDDIGDLTVSVNPSR